MMIKEKIFTCRRCGVIFLLKARKAFYCSTCARKVLSESVMRRRAAKNPDVKVGVGSGGNQFGEKNHMFTTGRENYRKVFIRENNNPQVCELCFSTRFPVVHHIDGNRKNNEPDNLIMLCRSCHAVVHNIVRNITENRKRNE